MNSIQPIVLWRDWLIFSPYLTLFALVMGAVHLFRCEATGVCSECGRPLEDKHE